MGCDAQPQSPGMQIGRGIVWWDVRGIVWGHVQEEMSRGMFREICLGEHLGKCPVNDLGKRPVDCPDPHADYKYLHAVVMICAWLTHRHTQAASDRLHYKLSQLS